MNSFHRPRDEKNRRFISLANPWVSDMKRFKKDKVTYFDYKDVKTLQRYVNAYGQIEPISRTGLSIKQQRQLATAIKRARHLALLPFVIQG